MKKRAALFLFVLISATAVFALAACSQNPAEEISVVINRSSLTMTEGDAYALTAHISPREYSDMSVSWKSSDESVVVCEGGRVTALGVGKATVTATVESGAYFTCKINVTDALEHIYLLEGETRLLGETLGGGYFDDPTCVSASDAIASISEAEGGVSVTANAPGRTVISLASGDSRLAYREIIVIPADTKGILFEYPELPLSIPYESAGYTTSAEIYEISVETVATPDRLMRGVVEVTLRIKYRKTSDTAGEDAVGAIGFAVDLYSGEAEERLRTEKVIKSNLAASSGEELEYVYKFEAVLDTGGGQRSFRAEILPIE